MLEVVRIPCLSDNYAWLVHDDASGETLAVDPGEAGPVMDAAAARGWRVDQVWNTHWHPDHVGGNADLKAAGAVVTGPAAEAARISTLDRMVAEGDVLGLGGHRAAVVATPGHTLGHVVFHFAGDALLFSGDTLFSMGCGRLFEGTPAQMFASLAKLAALPGGTRMCCGHEYTLSNARYALTVEPDNTELRARVAEVEDLRGRGEATVPVTLAVERATNPFLRARTVEELAARRAAKDSFRG